jgi:hypothetical protein
MDEFHPCKMSFIHMKSFIYGHIHPCRRIKITLNLKFQVQASHSCTNHFQSISNQCLFLLSLLLLLLVVNIKKVVSFFVRWMGWDYFRREKKWSKALHVLKVHPFIIKLMIIVAFLHTAHSYMSWMLLWNIIQSLLDSQTLYSTSLQGCVFFYNSILVILLVCSMSWLMLETCF